MKQEDLKELARRCRSIAVRADDFTKKRLLNLALKYEAGSEGRSLATRDLGALPAKNQNHIHHNDDGSNRG
jgi:hypothetical protein